METVRKIEPKKKPYIFPACALDLASKHILEFHVFAPEGITLEDLMAPESWVHIAYKLQPMAHIYVTSEPGDYAAMLRVTSCGQLWAKTQMIWYEELDSAKLDMNDDYEVVWISNKDKFAVKRKIDGRTMIDKLNTREEAAQAMANQLKVKP